MNRTRLIFIGVIALALGALVSAAVYKNLQSRSAGAAQPGIEVVVAASDIAVGERIEEKSIRLARFPEGDLPPNAIRDKSRVIGRGAVLPMYRGEFVLPNKLAGENAGSGLPALIPPGMRAMSVRVNEVVAVAGFVQPGTRVDVLLTGNPSGGDEQQTTTVLKNVLVIATGQKLERSTAGEAQMAAVITLLVSPDDAQKLTLASTQGRIQLALRNPLDTNQEELAAVNSGALYKGMPKPVVATAPRPRVKHTEAPPAPQTFSVEVYRGDKKEEKTF
ncbi:MAG: Flp pilus assembly protein CpaB [Acidobacteria bacterium]|jgi:pilus assembly protein CpaB|nr:Flp pilus assembly protein CpaB [Acidobacteriota bacterium]